MKEQKHAANRILALLLALMIVLPLGVGSALGEMNMNVQYFITVSWIDGNFISHTAQANPVQIPGYEDCYWVQVGRDAPMDGLQLDIADFSGQYAEFSPAPGTLLPPVADAGDSIDMGDRYVEIMAKTADGQPGALIYLYVSTVTDSPMLPPVVTEAPPAPVQPVSVNIHYVDEQGTRIADSTTQVVEEGTWPVYANPINLPENYHLNGNNYQNVTVGQFGADMTDVYFYYRYEKPVVQPVSVNVHYVDEQGTRIADSTTQMVEEGTWPVYANPINLPENYHLNGNNYQNVTVGQFGADMTDVYFYYRYEKPVVQPVSVNVHYVDEQGTRIADSTTQMVEEGTWPVYANPINLPENYHLNGNNYQNVTVGQFGADMTDVYFYYRYEVPATPAPTQGTIRVRLLEVSSNRELYAYDTQVTLGQVNDIYADLSRLPGEYVPAGDVWLQIEVDAFGNANPAPVFYFISNATPVPTQAPAPTETPFVAQPARVPVLYLSVEDGLPVAMDGTAVCQPGQATDVYPNPVNLIDGFVLVSEPVITVHVDAFGQPDQSEIVFLYQNVGGGEEQPTVTSQDITVWYYSLDMQQIASPTRFTCFPGVNQVSPAPFDLKAGYELIGDSVQYVELNENGLSATDITFYYQQVYRPTPAPVDVRVQYLSTDGFAVAQEQYVSCAWGQDTLIQANPRDLLADYVLEGSAQATVRVDDQGASPNPVIFYYRYVPNVPAPKIALVPVKYVRPDGVTAFYTYTETCVEGMDNIIRVDLSRMEPGYELASDAQVQVVVNSDGSFYPTEVVFQFRNEVNAYVTVYYQDFEGRNVASYQQQLCFVGNNSIMAQPLDLQGGYTLIGDNTQNVVLSQDGMLTPGAVVFRYQYTATPLPGTPTPFPFEYTAQNGYCYPKNDNINFRSEPSTALNTSIISQVSRRDLAQIRGRVRNAQNEIWYHVSIGGQEGFLKETVVRVLTDAEVAALFNYTLAPTQVPTPAPTPIPDGAAIDRWALTNAGGLNFRREPKTGNNVIRQISKNARVWVYSSQTVDGEKWYKVQVNGTEGYLMAKYLNVYSQQESDLLQQQLASPMPTQVPPPTQAPTLPPTQIPLYTPTLMPTQIPTLAPTATPAPYRGYAITLWMAALRTGISQGDESVLEMLPADSLVYVEWQNTVEGVTWSSVQSMRTNARGFMLHEGLRPITAEEASYYLNAMQPSQTATPEPIQEEGYAMTLGDGVPMRSFPDTNGEIMQLLPYGAVVSVRGQMYDGGTGWHMVQYNGDWGFIRQDQLRMMSQAEVDAYEQSVMTTPLPIPSQAPTAAPITQDSLSSYGHVKSNSGRVNLRSNPSTDSTRIRLLDNYAFALVMGTVETEDGIWYHVSQAGTEGYISGEYFKVLSLGELSQFLQSKEYLNANQSNTSSSTGNTTTQIQPVEDYNQTVWQNPALNASYEPFNPYVTPSPNPEVLPTATPTRAPTPSPTVYIAPVGPLSGLNTPAPTTTRQGGSPWPWVLLVIALAGIGAAVYAYNIHRKNEQRRRQAMRAQQARQARAAAAAQPQMRRAPNQSMQATRAYQAPPSASYMPPQGGSPRPAQMPRPDYTSQGTGRFPRTQAPAPQQGGVPATTNPFRPVTQRQADAYRASLEARARKQAEGGEAQGYAHPSVRQETQRFDPAQANASLQQSQRFAPVRQETQAYQPARAPQAPQAHQPSQETRTYQTFGAAQSPVTHQRQRRADRYQNDQGDSDA